MKWTTLQHSWIPSTNNSVISFYRDRELNILVCLNEHTKQQLPIMSRCESC